MIHTPVSKNNKKVAFPRQSSLLLHAVVFLLLVALVGGAVVVLSSAEKMTAIHEHSHRCTHDSPHVQEALYGPVIQDGSGLRRMFHPKHAPIAPSPSSTNNDTINPSTGRRSEMHTTADVAAKMRITFSTADLDDMSKFCDNTGETTPDFQGGNIQCTSNTILSASKKSVLTTIVLPKVKEILEELLHVIPLTTNLVISYPCPAPTTTPTSHGTTGVPNTDFLVYVSAAPTTVGTIAWASYCELNSNFRPITGRINISPAYLLWDANDPLGQRKLIRVIIHEMFHALGFSGQYLDFYPPLPKIVTSETRRGKLVSYVNATSIVDAAQNHFGCSTLNGPELEDEGGAGTAGSHWDRRTHFDDVMSGISGYDMYISNLTLTTLARTGHYFPNYTLVETPFWMKDAGCGVHDSKCNVAAGGLGTYFGFEGAASELVCLPDHSGLGIQQNSWYGADLPSYFQYWPAEPKRGGTELLMDYCPALTAFSNVHCANPSNIVANNTITGFRFATDSRCFKTSTNFVQTGYVVSGQKARCFKSRCAGADVQFTLDGGTTWTTCPGEGIVISGSSFGYDGTVTCPNPTLFCRNAPEIVAALTTTTTTTTTTAPTTTTTTTPTTSTATPTTTTTAAPGATTTTITATTTTPLSSPTPTTTTTPSPTTATTSTPSATTQPGQTTASTTNAATPPPSPPPTTTTTPPPPPTNATTTAPPILDGIAATVRMLLFGQGSSTAIYSIFFKTSKSAERVLKLRNALEKDLSRRLNLTDGACKATAVAPHSQQFTGEDFERSGVAILIRVDWKGIWTDATMGTWAQLIGGSSATNVSSANQLQNGQQRIFTIASSTAFATGKAPPTNSTEWLVDTLTAVHDAERAAAATVDEQYNAAAATSELYVGGVVVKTPSTVSFVQQCGTTNSGIFCTLLVPGALIFVYLFVSICALIHYYRKRNDTDGDDSELHRRRKQRQSQKKRAMAPRHERKTQQSSKAARSPAANRWRDAASKARGQRGTSQVDVGGGRGTGFSHVVNAAVASAPLSAVAPQPQTSWQKWNQVQHANNLRGASYRSQIDRTTSNTQPPPPLRPTTGQPPPTINKLPTGSVKPTAYHQGFYRTPPDSPLDNSNNAVRTFSNISCVSAQTIGGVGGGGGSGAYLTAHNNNNGHNGHVSSLSPLQSTLGGGGGGCVGFISRTGSRNIVLGDSPPWGGSSPNSHHIANVRPTNSYHRSSSARTPTTPPMGAFYAMLDD